MTTPYKWRFLRAGGFDQVRLESGADLMALDQLDQKLWVALACPTTTIDVDPRTLALIDGDNDKKVRASELIAACKWAGQHLKNPDDLLAGKAELAIAAINAAEPSGKALADAAVRVLTSLGKAASTAITVAEASDAVRVLHSSPLNGDGVVVEKSTADEELKAALRDVVACLEGEADRSGALGAGKAKIEKFFADAADYLAWHDAWNAANAPLADPAAARALMAALRPKLADYFTRCRLASFDPRAGTAMNREDKDYLALSARELKHDAPEIAAFPLSRVEAGRPLPLKSGLNPAWEQQVHALAATVIRPVLGEKAELTEADWAEVEAKFAAFDTWQAQKKGAAVERLGVPRLRALVKSDAKAKLLALVEEDLAVEPVSKALGDLERLVRYHRDLFKLANNFVCFRDFYARRSPASFQAGTLYIDQRSCDLCIRVEDTGKHSTLAPLARTFLLYCDCTRDGKKMTIAAAVTAGDSDNLMVGRNGVFYDREGKDWDATITRIVDNPISVGQAFWSPYKKVVRFIEEQVAKRATEADGAANSKLTGAATELGSAVQTGAPREPPKPKFEIGMVAALGVAVGGITAALGALMQAFFGLGAWMPLGLLAIVLAISGPSMAVAWLKLRQRNLAPLLDASGWAMNAPARINLPFGRALTQVAELPKNASRDLRDPFAEKETPWVAYGTAALALAVIYAWAGGHVDGFIPEHARPSYVFKSSTPPKDEKAPAPPAAAAPAPTKGAVATETGR